MNGKCLVDTNVFLYAADPTEGGLSHKATRVIEGLLLTNRAVITPQVVAEFYVNAIKVKRGRRIMSPREAIVWTEFMFQHASMLDITEVISRHAVGAAYAYSLGIYDAQLWACAYANGIDLIVSQDSPGGKTRIQGVRYIDPFSSDFDLADLGL